MNDTEIYYKKLNDIITNVKRIIKNEKSYMIETFLPINKKDYNYISCKVTIKIYTESE